MELRFWTFLSVASSFISDGLVQIYIGINNCKICSSLGQSKALFFSRLFMKLNFLLPRREKKNVVDKQVLFGRTWVVDCVERGQCRGNN